jgi:hypothetical protein
MQYDELRGAFRSFDKALDRLCSAEYNEMKWNPHYPFPKIEMAEISYEDFKKWAVRSYENGEFEEWDIFEVEVEED